MPQTGGGGGGMKLYLFNPVRVWVSNESVAICAESAEQARAWYVQKFQPGAFTMTVVEIVLGLALIPEGYDDVWIRAERLTMPENGAIMRM